jgi:hypothetical protein
MLKIMKKMTFVACTAMLASVVAFTGCNSDKNEPGMQQGVTTDIAISLPGQVGGTTFRMPSATVQLGGHTDFGDNGMVGITLVPFAKSEKVTTTSKRQGENIVLGSIGTTQTYTNSANGRAKVFTGKSVPLGTSAFLFYGESGKTGTEFEKGVLTASLTGEPSAFTFSLQPIVTNAATVEADGAYTGLIAFLNAVAQASDGVKEWRNYTALDNEGLFELFKTYATTHVLSSFHIQRQMTDLYKTLMPSSDAMSTAIKTIIGNGTYATVDGAGNVTLVEGLRDFPETKFNIPQGAVEVAYDNDPSVKAFGGNAAHAYGSLDPATIDTYVYPASLWYTSNTQIKTHNTSLLDNYTGAASWQSILDAYTYNNSSVNSKTRSIALKDTVQYAVARLDVCVKFKENTWLVDNDPVDANNKVSNPAAGYPLSAILVGGQKNVGFDFTQGTYAGGTTVTYTIYDKVMTNTIAANSTAAYSPMNSTLVLETPASTDEFIALEFTNTSDKDFYGVNGIVPMGGKFYLVGQLSAAAATETGNKVFKQDYTTTVRVAIKDLKSAYTTIPDLKAPQLEIGLSVDLHWESGHTYDLEL